MKKLSIIIPLYNVSEYVQKAAQSIACQAFEGLEVVVVDDGSLDNSLEICLKYLSDIDTLVVKKENGGLSSARNAGILAATGEYLLFLDSDDFLLFNALEKILSTLEREQPDVLFGRYLNWSPSVGFSQCKSYKWNPPADLQRRTEYIINGLPEPSWNAWRYVCRREVILKHALFFENGLLCEDVPWTLKLLDTAKTMSFLPQPFYAYYLRRTGSIMNTRTPKRLIDLNSIVVKLATQYLERPGIYKKLITQSFLYINEYCTFNQKDRKRIWKSYKSVLPIYKNSPSKLHKIAAICNNKFLFHILSISLFSAKCARGVWKYAFG
ncbi:MAG: glycosyltransferase [Defluviitaleaceae bacterium]|nr:glycosyltransferase [Defluviitaleaceae bacterium]